MKPEDLQTVRDLAEQGMKPRAIARKLGRDRKAIRRALGPPPAPPSPPKLDPFHDAIRERLDQGLSGPRILRELRALGYTGKRTLLNNFLRKERGPRKLAHKVFRRFETAPGEEAQVDWSPYRVLIGGVLTLVHAFSMVLAYSRMLFIAFYRNEKLPTLLHAHAEAFEYFQGLCRTCVYDNMTTVTLGRIGGKPLWNPGFLDFAKHYGFTPKVCRVAHPDRKGKVEKIFAYLHGDFVKGSSFDSWADLNARVRTWLETVANPRVHATLREVPNDRFLKEKPLLIGLPSAPYPSYAVEVRKVQSDGYVAVGGSFYPVPAALVGQHVSVRIAPTRMEVLSADGRVVAAHAIPERPTRLPSGGGPPPVKTTAPTQSELEARFLARFPGAGEFLEGLQRRMKALTPIHVRRIEQLREVYGAAPLHAALIRATVYRNFSADALRRILETALPNIVPETPMVPLHLSPAALGALDDVEPGSPADYVYDSMAPTKKDSHAHTTEDADALPGGAAAAPAGPESDDAGA